MSGRFRSPGPIKDQLREVGHLADDMIADALFFADGLRKPLLIEGPAGVGKTELAKATATLTGARPIIELRVPGLMPVLARQAARVVHALRSLDLHKPPSISESVDWARSLMLLGVADLDSGVISRTLPVLIKNHRDIEHASAELDLVSSAGKETSP